MSISAAALGARMIGPLKLSPFTAPSELTTFSANLRATASGSIAAAERAPSNWKSKDEMDSPSLAIPKMQQ